jgi:Fe-S cluster biosynthesis and repair protein YggX
MTNNTKREQLALWVETQTMKRLEGKLTPEQAKDWDMLPQEIISSIYSKRDRKWHEHHLQLAHWFVEHNAEVLRGSLKDKGFCDQHKPFIEFCKIHKLFETYGIEP